MKIQLENFWHSLLDKIQDGRIIPVIGPDLIEVEVDGRMASLQSHLAHRLAAMAGLDSSATDGNAALFDVVSRAHRADREADYHGQINRLLREFGKPKLPSALASLARITDFKLYLTLGFDGLLTRAIAEERDEVDHDIRHLAYAPNQQRTDLPAPLADMREPLVYSLFGKSCTAPEFVICDDDLLEWVTALQDPDNRPPLLFDALRTNHLLFIGCDLPDWLLRFFIRLTRENRISLSRANETLIGSQEQVNGSLVSFLDRFSPKTTVLDMAPRDFVAELERRWLERHRQLSVDDELNVIPEDIRPGGVFLSYASEDVDAASHLQQTMQERQIDTWFDARRLLSGAHYDEVISRNIGRCGVMLPVISRAALARLEHWRTHDGFQPDKKPYFLREWELALSRKQFQPKAMVILPVRIDDADLDSSLLPEALRELTCGHTPDGQPNLELLDKIKQSVRDARKQLRQLA